MWDSVAEDIHLASFGYFRMNCESLRKLHESVNRDIEQTLSRRYKPLTRPFVWYMCSQYILDMFVRAVNKVIVP
jgi:hypothetical protein